MHASSLCEAAIACVQKVCGRSKFPWGREIWLFGCFETPCSAWSVQMTPTDEGIREQVACAHKGWITAWLMHLPHEYSPPTASFSAKNYLGLVLASHCQYCHLGQRVFHALKLHCSRPIGHSGALGGCRRAFSVFCEVLATKADAGESAKSGRENQCHLKNYQTIFRYARLLFQASFLVSGLAFTSNETNWPPFISNFLFQCNSRCWSVLQVKICTWERNKVRIKRLTPYPYCILTSCSNLIASS